MIRNISSLALLTCLLAVAGCTPIAGGPDGGACSQNNCAGCCDSTGICQPGTANGSCGTAGAACASCGGGLTCSSTGVCKGPACTPESCGNGCCAPNGTCISPSNTIAACGTNGAACQVCTGQQACASGTCTNTGSCTGCLDTSGACQGGTSTSACGTNGALCQACTTGQSCTNGQCTGGQTCNASTCPSGCCNGSTCVQYGNQTTGVCGAGGAACHSCPGTETCNGSGVCTGGGGCSASSCPNGCCNGSSCVAYASETNSECGTGGAACQSCGGGQTCNGSGVCTGGGGCSASTCPQGCCNGATCVPYASETNSACGTAGATCEACTGGQTCSSGACTGGGTVGNNGGSVPSLYFAVIGDTRPGSNNSNNSYPTAIITKIYQDIEALNPKPQFVLTTGDYQFDDPGAMTGGQLNSDVQIGDYATAQSNWTGGPVFMAMGNHECNGYTSSNMDLSNLTCDGVASTNYTSWFNKLVAPLGKTLPYYTIPINATDGSWTSKFIIVACNAWDSTQQSWLQAQLATSTTYTFLVRHEDPTATTGPCVSAMDSMLASATYNALIVGHVHQYCSGSLSSATSCTYPASNVKFFVVGNGGAVTSNDGYVLVKQSGSTFTVSDYDYSTNQQVATFSFQ